MQHDRKKIKRKNKNNVNFRQQKILIEKKKKKNRQLLEYTKNEKSLRIPNKK